MLDLLRFKTQSYEGLMKVELPFPFKGSFTVSAAGWSRCQIGWNGRDIGMSSDIELGLQVPKAPMVLLVFRLNTVFVVPPQLLTSIGKVHECQRGRWKSEESQANSTVLKKIPGEQ